MLMWLIPPARGAVNVYGVAVDLLVEGDVYIPATVCSFASVMLGKLGSGSAAWSSLMKLLWRVTRVYICGWRECEGCWSRRGNGWRAFLFFFRTLLCLNPRAVSVYSKKP